MYIVAQNDTCPYSDRITEVYAAIDQCMSVLKTLKFSLVLRIRENSDVFNTLKYTSQNNLEIKLLSIDFWAYR